MHRREYMKSPAISATEWVDFMLPLLEEGHELKIIPQGGSMVPFLVGGRDEAILSSVGDVKKLKRRDIILYSLPDGIHVLHRIHHINKKGIYTLGDSQSQIDGPYSSEDVLAIAKTIIRKGKTIKCDKVLYNLLVEIWLWVRPFRSLIIQLWLKRFKLKIFR